MSLLASLGDHGSGHQDDKRDRHSSLAVNRTLSNKRRIQNSSASRENAENGGGLSLGELYR